MAIPVGTVVSYSLQTIAATDDDNESWLPCDGSNPARSDYPDLFNIIGGIFGTNGSGDFYLPDLRGYFVRSPDGGTGRDPDAGSRVCMATNGLAGDNPGSVQGDCVAAHTHQLENTWGCYYTDSDGQTVKNNVGTPPPPQSVTAATQSSETRPCNAAFAFYILAENPVNRFPLGSIVTFAGATDPPADTTDDNDVWLICDGRALSRQTYSDFYTAFAAVLGSGDGTTTFNVPDFRGLFIRGVDPTATRDPAVASRAPMFPNTPGGANVGSLQPDQYSSHQHVTHGDTSAAHDGGGDTQIYSSNNDGGDSAGLTDDAGPGLGSETRPKNAYLYQIIRIQ